MNPITIRLNVETVGTDLDDPVQMQLVIVPAAEVEQLQKTVDILQRQNSMYEKQLDSLRARLHEIMQLFGDLRKGRL